ncbi:hypothetical protein KY284_010616 [Solanum tuberosum]|nr:hypothetical protein KY284_010616 [Solanum tuberosum]
MHQQFQQFQKGKVKILSSEKVIGYPRAWKVVGPIRSNNNENQESTSQHEDITDQPSKHVKSRKEWVLQTFGKQELPTQRKDANSISEQPRIQSLEKPLDTLQSVVTHSDKESAKKAEGENELINQKSTIFGSVEYQCSANSEDDLSITINSVTLYSPVLDNIEENKNEGEVITEDNVSKVIIALPHQQVVVLPVAMSSPAIHVNNQQLDNQVSMLVERVQGGDVDVNGKKNLKTGLSQAIIEVPRVVQLDDSQLIQMESPTRMLHTIISYNFDVENSCNNGSHGTLIAEGLMEEDNIDEFWFVQLEADLSPRRLKSARKGKK